MATTEQIGELVFKYLNNSLSEAEGLTLDNWINESSIHAAIFEELTAPSRIQEGMLAYYASKDVKPRVDKQIQDYLNSRNESILPAVHRIHFLKTAWFRYAAILVLIAGTATFFYLDNQPQKEIALAQLTKQSLSDILPGGNKAILTLSDGSRIVLDSAANGQVAWQGYSRITKLASGSIVYAVDRPGANMTEGSAAMNTLSTPKGGQYQLILPDGTKVWLNAASSITYPAAFLENTRMVKVTGEAYFEVAASKTQPFRVQAGGDDIQVLGTRFNVNAYPDEQAVKTSLVDGKVRIGNVTLLPGQAFSGGQLVVSNITRDIAWKNGVFDFQDKKLVEVMRQIARWYDLEVVYAGKVPSITLVGEVSRKMQLADMLETLEQLEVHYTMKGRTITILP